MSENKATLKGVMLYEEGIKDGYEKGVRDMWEATRQKCGYRIVTLCDIGGVCNIETCPIAQKLLKGVK